MSTIRAVVVASDLSERARLAVERGRHLAEEHGAAVHIVHVLDPDAEGPPVRAAEDRLHQQVSELGIDSLEVRSGTPFVEIIRAARAQDADLIVLGAHGSDTIEDRFLGTTAERVVRKGDRSVLVVNRPAFGRYERVLVAVDYSDDAARALAFTCAVAPRAEMSVAHAFVVVGKHKLRGTIEQLQPLRDTVTRDEEEQLARFVHEHAPEQHMQQLLVEGRPNSEIPDLAARLDAELVVVGARGRRAIRHVLLGSVAQHVLRDATCDVLVVRHGRAPFELP